MAVVVYRAIVRRALPQNLSRIAVQAEHLQRLFPVARDGVRMYKGFALPDMTYGFRPGYDFAFNGSSQEDPVAPDNRRRKTATGKRRLPGDVLVHAPLDGKILLFRDAQTLRATPLRPVRYAVA